MNPSDAIDTSVVVQEFRSLLEQLMSYKSAYEQDFDSEYYIVLLICNTIINMIKKSAENIGILEEVNGKDTD